MPRTAKPVPSTSPEAKQRRLLASFIVTKYIHPTKIEPKRDFILAYKLIKKFPLYEFWVQMPCLKKVSTMAALYTVESRKKLTAKYRIFEHLRKIQKSVVIQPDAPKIELGDKVGEDYVCPVKKPRNILEFCR